MRLGPRRALVPRGERGALVRGEFILARNLPLDHLLGREVFPRRDALETAHLLLEVLPLDHLPSPPLLAALQHRLRERLAEAALRVFARYYDDEKPGQPARLDGAHDGRHLAAVEPRKNHAPIGSELAALIEPIVRPRLGPIRLLERLERGAERLGQKRLRHGNDRDVVAPELVHELAHPRRLLRAETREKHRRGTLGLERIMIFRIRRRGGGRVVRPFF